MGLPATLWNGAVAATASGFGRCSSGGDSRRGTSTVRTTLNIDDDVLLAAKERARHDKTSLGQTVSALVRMLAESTQTAFHAFWPDEASILDARTFSHPRIHTGRHLTDLYLLALAVQRQGRLVSCGQRIPLSAVVGAGPQHLLVL